MSVANDVKIINMFLFFFVLNFVEAMNINWKIYGNFIDAWKRSVDCEISHDLNAKLFSKPLFRFSPLLLVLGKSKMIHLAA